jgi:hypothetical protein
MTTEQMVALMRQAYEALYFIKTQNALDADRGYEPIDVETLASSVYDLCADAQEKLYRALKEYDDAVEQAAEDARERWMPERQLKQVGYRKAIVWQQKPWRWKVEGLGAVMDKGECDTEDEAKAAALKVARGQK